MRASQPRKKRLPSLASEKQEASYRTMTDSAKHLDDASEVVPVEVEVDRGGNLRGIYIRLPERLLAGLKRVALRKELPYQLLIREWLAERLEEERGRQLPAAVEDDVILLRRFSIRDQRGPTHHEGWMVVREVKAGRYVAEPWWEGLQGGKKTKAQTSPEKAVEEGYRLLERLWRRKFQHTPAVSGLVLDITPRRRSHRIGR